MKELNKALHRTAHKAPPVTADVMQRNYMNSKLYLVVVLAVAFLARLLFLSCYGPVHCNDTPGYMEVSSMIGSGNFSGYTGWRTPGYPIIMYLCGNSYTHIVVLQSLCGIIGTLLLFYSLLRSTCSPHIALLYGLFLASALNMVVIDSNIMTESLAACLFATIVFLLFAEDTTSHPIRWPHSLAMGLLMGFLIVIRPQFIAMIPVVTFYMAFRWYTFKQPIWRFTLPAFLVSACIPVIMLLGFNTAHLGKPMLSTTIGFNISQHTLPFIESAKRVDTMGIIPETVRLRDEYWDFAQSLDDNRAFIPRPEIAGTKVEQSDYLVRLSKEAIKNNPLKYLQSATSAWMRFWRVSLLYDADNTRCSALDKYAMFMWPIYKLLWLFLNLLFLISSGLAVITVLKRREIGWYECSIALILAVSILQALVEYGDNSRYAIPLEPSVGMIAVYSLFARDNNRITIASTLRRFRWRSTSESEA